MPTERMFTVGGDGAGIVPHVDGAGYHALLHGHVLWIVVPPRAFCPTLCATHRATRSSARSA